MKVTSAVSKVLLTTGMIGASTASGVVSWPLLIAFVCAWVVKEVADSGLQDKIRSSIETSRAQGRTALEAIEELRSLRGIDGSRIESLVELITEDRSGDASAEKYLLANQKLLIDLTRLVADRFDAFRAIDATFGSDDLEELRQEVRGYGHLIEDTHSIARGLLTKEDFDNQMNALRAEILQLLSRKRGNAATEDESTVDSAVSRIREWALGGDRHARLALASASPAEAFEFYSGSIVNNASAQRQATSDQGVSINRELSVLAISVGRADRAEPALLEILRQRPGDLNATNDLGLCYLQGGRLDEATRMFKKILELTPHDTRWQAIASGNLGIVLKLRGELEEAERLFNVALTLHTSLGDVEGIANQQGSLGQVFYARGDLEAADAMLRNSLSLYESIGHHEGVAIQLGVLGVIALSRGDLDEAESLQRRSMAISEAIDDKAGLANDYLNLSNVYQMRGDYVGAEKLINQSIELSEETGSREGIANGMGSLALLLSSRGDLEGAEVALRRGLRIEESMGRRRGMASAYGNLGIVLGKQGELDEAESLVRLALETVRGLGDIAGVATNLCNLGMIMHLRGRLTEAIEVLLDAQEHAERAESVEGVALCSENLGSIYGELGRLEDARKELTRAIEIFDTMGVPDRASEIREQLRNLGTPDTFKIADYFPPSTDI